MTKPIALITGATSGLGRACALMLAQKGYDLILTGRRETMLMEVSRQAEALGARAAAFPADLGNSGEREKLIAFVDQNFPCPKLLLNNAGYGIYDYFIDQSWESISDMMRVNVEAVFHLASHYMKRMRDDGGGQIINMGSMAGDLHMQGIAAYGASKAGVNALSTALWRESRRSPVKVSLVCPGPIKTEFFAVSREKSGGLNIPIEWMAVDESHVTAAVWSLIRRPRRVVYVPWYMRAAPWLELILGFVFDHAGPLLLEIQNRRRTDR